MNFTDILDELEIPYDPNHHHSTEGFIQIDCPFCTKNTQRFLMGYNIKGQYVHCWHCGHHDLTNTLIEASGLPYQTIKDLLSNLETPNYYKITTPLKRKGKLILPYGIDNLQNAHIKYLKKRGFNNINELIHLWNIKGIGIAPYLSWSIFIPIYQNNEMVSWTTRSLSSTKKKKYIHAGKKEESVERNKILYGGDYTRHAIIICEGPIDVWKIGPGTVATLGTAYSNEQVNQMISHPIRYVCFDNDEAGQRKAEQLCDLLSVFPGETHNIQLDSKDAGSATQKEINTLRRLLK